MSELTTTLIYNDNGHDIAIATADGSLCLGTFTPLSTDGAEAFKRLVDAANLSAGAELPAFVAELEALQAKTKNSRSPIGSSFISTTPEGYDFAQYLIDHAPP